MADVLETKHDAQGWRHYLDGRPIHVGDLVECEVQRGEWIAGRYYWRFHPSDLPRLSLFAGELVCAAHARFRWPPSEVSA